MLETIIILVLCIINSIACFALGSYITAKSFNNEKVFKKKPDSLVHFNQHQLVELEQAILDFMGEEGWFPAGYRVIGPTRDLFYIFSRVKDEDDS